MPTAELTTILLTLVEPLLDPLHRVFAPFLATSLLLAVFVGLRSGLRPRELPSFLFPRKLWLHDSALVDYQLCLCKGLVRWAGLVPWGLASWGLAAGLVAFLDRRFGIPEAIEFNPFLLTGLYSVVLFLVWDSSRYVLHRLLHRVPFLWQFHQVHHSAEVLTPVTFYRSHPIESFLYWLRGVIATGLVAGVFFWLFRGQAETWQLVGVHGLGFVFNIAGGNLRHSHVWLSWGRRVEHLLISPAQHQLHHSRDVSGNGTNFGSWLAIWDWMGGSLTLAGEKRVLRFGLRSVDRNHQPRSLVSVLVDPLRDSFSGLRPSYLALFLGGCLLAMFVGPAASAAEGGVTDDSVEEESEDSEASGDSGEESSGTSEASGDETSGTSDDSGEEPSEDAGDQPADDSGEEASGTAGDSVDEAADDSGEEPSDESENDSEDEPRDVPEVEGGPSPVPASEEEGLDGAPRIREVFSVIGRRGGPARVAGSAHKIDQEELERQEQDDIHQLLDDIPGVYVRTEDGYGLRPNIGFRGAAADRSAKVTLMEDGILLAPAPYSAPAAYYFPLPTRMVGLEVFKGPAATRHGPNTVGGALNLLTRAIPDETDLQMDFSYGLRKSWKLHGWGGARASWGGVLIEAAHLSTAGFKELPDGADTGFDKTEVMFKGRLNTPMSGAVVSAWELKLGYAHEDSRETYLGLSDTDFEANPYRRYAASSLGRMGWHRTQAELRWQLASENLEVEVVGYHHWQERSWQKLNRFRSGPSLSDILAYPDSGQSAVYAAILRGEEDTASDDQRLLVGTNAREFHSWGVQSQGQWRLETSKVTSSLQWGVRLHGDQVERLHTEDPFEMVSGAMTAVAEDTAIVTDNKASSIAFSAHVHEELGFGPVRLLPGLRVEVIRGRFEDKLSGVDTALTRAVVLPGLGLYVQPTPWMGVLAGVHRGFSPVSPGQPEEVKPEESWNVEAGLRFDHKGFHGEAIGFFNDYSNLTGQCTLSSGCPSDLLDQQHNGGQVHVYGLEALLGYEALLPEGFILKPSLSYTWTGSRFRTTFNSPSPHFGQVREGDSLGYVPEHRGAVTLGLLHSLGGVELSFSGQTEMRDVPGQGEVARAEGIPAQYSMDLNAQLRITSRAQLYVTLTNITNQAQMVSRRPYGARPGRPFHAMVGLKIDLQPQDDGIVELLRSKRAESRIEAPDEAKSPGVDYGHLPADASPRLPASE
jgi:Fe(3+) dicitrate transport protein